MKTFKALAVGLAAIAVTGSALAIPTLTISDGLTTVTVTDASGIVVYANPSFDASWSVVISTAETKPALGTAASPVMDLNVQATSLSANPVRNLTITFSDNSFGPAPSAFQTQMSGHVVSGTGQNVTYNTYVSAANVVGAQTTLLTASGIMAPPTYSSVKTGSVGTLALYSITQVVTINGTPVGTTGGSYSLDASLTGVPDGGTTVMLLGAALSGLAFLRRKLA